MSDPFSSVSNEWLEDAWNNFERACRGIRAEDYMQAVFYSHQTIEAALKAYLVSKGYQVLRTYDLKLLTDIARKLSLNVNVKMDDLEELTQHYLATRYPDARLRLKIPKEYYSRSIALKFLNLAYKILISVEMAIHGKK